MRKNLILLFSSVLMLSLLTGCGSQTLSCSKKDSSTEDMEITQKIDATFSGDTVTNVLLTSEVKVSGIYESYAEQLEETFLEEYKELGKKEGINLSSNIQDKTIVIKLDANFKKMNTETKESLDIVSNDQSLEDAKKELESEGYTCK